MKSIDYTPAIEEFAKGGLAIVPTDTVYGLVAQAKNPEACAKLYQLKNREDKPGTVLAESIDQLVDLGLKAKYLKPVADYWPNPISIVIPTGPVLDYLHLGKYALAVRIPASQEFRSFLKTTGPLLSTSANLPGETPAGSVGQAKIIFGNSVEAYIDGGDLTGRLASTIIRIVDDAVKVLRPGAIKIDESGKIY